MFHFQLTGLQPVYRAALPITHAALRISKHPMAALIVTRIRLWARVSLCRVPVLFTVCNVILPTKGCYNSKFASFE